MVESCMTSGFEIRSLRVLSLRLLLRRRSSTNIYYMATFVSGQDESNLALSLACPVGVTRRRSRKKHFPESYIINPLLTKLDIGLVLFWSRVP